MFFCLYLKPSAGQSAPQNEVNMARMTFAPQQGLFQSDISFR